MDETPDFLSARAKTQFMRAFARLKDGHEREWLKFLRSDSGLFLCSLTHHPDQGARGAWDMVLSRKKRARTDPPCSEDEAKSLRGQFEDIAFSDPACALVFGRAMADSLPMSDGAREIFSRRLLLERDTPSASFQAFCEGLFGSYFSLSSLASDQRRALFGKTLPKLHEAPEECLRALGKTFSSPRLLRHPFALSLGLGCSLSSAFAAKTPPDASVLLKAWRIAQENSSPNPFFPEANFESAFLVGLAFSSAGIPLPADELFKDRTISSSAARWFERERPFSNALARLDGAGAKVTRERSLLWRMFAPDIHTYSLFGIEHSRLIGPSGRDKALTLPDLIQHALRLDPNSSLEDRLEIMERFFGDTHSMGLPEIMQTLDLDPDHLSLEETRLLARKALLSACEAPHSEERLIHCLEALPNLFARAGAKLLSRALKHGKGDGAFSGALLSKIEEHLLGRAAKSRKPKTPIPAGRL